MTVVSHLLVISGINNRRKAMPRNELISFKKDKDAQFIAQLVIQQRGETDDTFAFDSFGKYTAALRKKTGEYVGENDPTYHLVSQTLREVESLQALILRAAISPSPRQKRDAIIDAVKSLKRLQSMQETLVNKNIFIFPKGDRVNGPWGGPEYVTAYVTTMGRCKEGAELLESGLFDVNNKQIVAEFDELMAAPYFDYNNYKVNKQPVRTYMMYQEEFENYMSSRPQIQVDAKENVGGGDADNVNLEGSYAERYNPDPAYTFDKEKIIAHQKSVKEKIVKSLGKSIEKNDNFARDLNAFINDLKKFHYDVQENPDMADEKTQYVDSLLSQRKIERRDVGRIVPEYKYTLKMNLQNPEPQKFLDSLVYFVGNIESYNESKNRDKNSKLGDINEVFSKEDGEGFSEILSSLKAFQKDPQIPDTFKAKCKVIQNKFETMVANAFNELEADPFEKYIAMNTGAFNFGKGENVLDGVAKVTAAYEWKKKNERVNDPAKKEAFDPAKIDKLAEDMKKDPVFRTYYTTNDNGQKKWSKASLESAAKNSTEWKVNSLIDNPFVKATLANKRKALKSLKELGSILPDPGSASREYHRFNGMLKGLGSKNIDRLAEGELNYLLKNIFDENEKYMKGRKSARFKDASKEHFEETLDVLKIYSDLSDYGAALAKKLVDRTNYVRKHRWHGMWEQDTVTLEGRSNEATKNRIDVLIHGKKPAPVQGDAPKL